MSFIPITEGHAELLSKRNTRSAMLQKDENYLGDHGAFTREKTFQPRY